jgi:hypothetical protein
MNKKSQRISRRTVANFLKVSAAALALSAEIPAATASSRPVAATPRPATTRTAARIERQSYRHAFVINAADAEYPARVTVATPQNNSVLESRIHAPAKLGPLADGAYVVTIRTRGSVERQLVRIGPDTGRELIFLAEPEQA